MDDSSKEHIVQGILSKVYFIYSVMLWLSIYVLRVIVLIGNCKCLDCDNSSSLMFPQIPTAE